MKVLAIESSAVTASVAIMTEDTLIAEYTINYKKTHSQTLLPMIDEICRMTENNAADCDIIAVSNGPGSFTGLRIGAATGKVVRWARERSIPVISWNMVMYLIWIKGTGRTRLSCFPLPIPWNMLIVRGPWPNGRSNWVRRTIITV